MLSLICWTKLFLKQGNVIHLLYITTLLDIKVILIAILSHPPIITHNNKHENGTIALLQPLFSNLSKFTEYYQLTDDTESRDELFVTNNPPTNIPPWSLD